jgi:hypothetical protein
MKENKKTKSQKKDERWRYPASSSQRIIREKESWGSGAHRRSTYVHPPAPTALAVVIIAFQLSFLTCHSSNYPDVNLSKALSFGYELARR